MGIITNDVIFIALEPWGTIKSNTDFEMKIVKFLEMIISVGFTRGRGGAGDIVNE